jgi:GH35 family endo-1,4-beta-xylanase
MSPDDLYSIFLEWRTRPIGDDDPQNIAEFCTLHNTDRATLKEFTKRPGYNEDLISYSLQWARNRIPELVQLVYNKVKLSKNVKDLESFVNIVEDLSNKDKYSGGAKIQNNFFINDQQYQQILAREVRALTPGGTE